VNGEFEIDMTTISNTDIKDEDYHKKYLNHMISEDFFDVKQFKTAKFVIKSAKKIKADNYEIKGDLTIKGKTDAIAFDAVANQKEAHAKIIFDRTKFDIKYGSANFFKSIGDKAINDKVQLDVVLKAKK
jgi:polyisoprenoid-binding protein YceI